MPIRPALAALAGLAESCDDLAMDERGLIRDAKTGDATACARLTEHVYPEVQQMVHGRLMDGFRRGRPWLSALFSTGDVVHNVLLEVMRDLRTFAGDDPRALRKFLAKAVMHQILDTVRFHEAGRRDARRVGREVDVSAVRGSSEQATPTRIAASRDETAAVQDCLLTMSPRDQALIELRFRSEMTYGEIAAELDIPSDDAARKAVRSAHARLLIKLRAKGLE